MEKSPLLSANQPTDNWSPSLYLGNCGDHGYVVLSAMLLVGNINDAKYGSHMPWGKCKIIVHIRQ